jgi:hypothetical protein
MKRSFFVMCICAALFLFSCEECAEPENLLANSDALNFHSMFGNEVNNVRHDFETGEYGTELYYLAIRGGLAGGIAIFKNDTGAQITVYQWTRYKTRQLTEDEINSFESFITKNEVNNLPGWSTGSVIGGSEFQFMHFCENNQTTFYMNNPSVFRAGRVYGDLISKFYDLAKTGDFEVRYDIEEEHRILIMGEDHFVESVWKNGDDFRVLIKDVENSDWKHTQRDWFKFENGVVGEKTYEPEGVTMQNPWADIPGTEAITTRNGLFSSITSLSGFQFSEHHNNYPWQVQWNSYFVRELRCLDTNTFGLWRVKPGERPVLISEGQYSGAIVIPETDWVICLRSNGGWQISSSVVKINLNTFEEVTLDLPLNLSPNHSTRPLAYINGKVLIGGGYLYDVHSNTLERVEGDFSVFQSGRLRGRFFQEASEPYHYFATGNQFTIGVFSTQDFSYTPLMRLPLLIYVYTNMWVDEINNVVYITTSNGDLLELPFINNL